MKFDYDDPPVFRVFFDDETSWQRRQAKVALSVFIDKDSFIWPDKLGNILTTTINNPNVIDNLIYHLGRAAQLPTPYQITREKRDQFLTETIPKNEYL